MLLEKTSITHSLLDRMNSKFYRQPHKRIAKFGNTIEYALNFKVRKKYQYFHI